MDLNDFGSRLKREFLRNKKKSAILAIGSMVAIYFWAPLVMEWLPLGETTPAPQGVVVAPPQNTAVPTPAVAARKPSIDWLALSSTIAADVMMDHVHIKLHRNPFAPVQPETLVVADAKPAEPPKASPVEQGPGLSTADIKLTSIMIGPAFSEAVIDGETYMVNDEVDLEVEVAKVQNTETSEATRLPSKSASTTVRTRMKARIVEIHHDHVLLVLNHRMRKLPLFQTVSSGMTIKRNSP